jgi:O-antigen ligase
VALAAATPWPFGSVSPVAVWIVTLLVLATVIAVLVAQAWRDGAAIPEAPVWPLFAWLAVTALQLVPSPSAVLALLAPGPASLWYPPVESAAQVLGRGPRPLSIDPEATRRWLAFTAGATGLCLLAAPALADRRRALRAVLAVLGFGLVLAVYGVVARTLFGSLLYGRIPVPTVSPFGPFYSKNHFAGYVEMATLLALGLAVGLADEARGSGGGSWMQSARAGRVVFAYGAAAAMGLAVLVSLSRGGTLSLAGGCLVFAVGRVLVRRRRRERAKMAWALGVATVVLAGGALAVLPSEARARVMSLAGIASDQSGVARLALWRDTLRAVGSSPFLGYGQGAFPDTLPRFKTVALDLRAEHAENDYLELLAEGGGAALLLGLAVIAVLARRLVHGLREQPDRRIRGLGLGATAGLSALLVHSAFDFNLRIPSNALLFAFLGAVALAAGTGVRPIGVRPAVAAAAMSTLLFGLVLSPPGAEHAARLPEVRPLLDAPGPLRLRWALADTALVERLHQRPADAEAWALLGWVRALRGDTKEGAALARYGASLDPQRVALRAEADRLEGLARP